MGGQGRETLAFETNENLSFKREKGYFLSYLGVALLLVAFLIAILATGLLVYFFADNGHVKDDLKYDVIEHDGIAESGAVSSIGKKLGKEAKKKVMDVRLPRSIKPLHYLVKLLPFINGNFSIHGYTETTFEVLEETYNVTMHINGIITKNETIQLKSIEGQVIGIKKHLYDKDRQFYVAILSHKLKAGRKFTISMEFIGYLNDNMDGFYRSSYMDESGTQRWLAATQFQPTDARKAFPCFDEPALKANFTIELGRKDTMNSISNMPLKESVPMEGNPGWFWDKFETSVPMSTYLVAFVVSDFVKKKSVDDNSYDFHVYARKSAIDQAEYAIRIGPVVSKFFEEYYQVPYPLPKQDMVAIPDFSAGAMENWGIITYRETAMLYDPKISRASDKEYVGAVIAHELAHQWFGNLVTPSWWTDLWLNEGFASYMEYLGIDAAEPSFKMNEQFVLQDLHPAFALDSLKSSHPINIEVQHPDQINEIFDKISYSKGAAIIRMMNYFLGEGTFRKGLTEYLKALSYSTAEQNDLWHYLTEQAHNDGSLPMEMNVKDIMDTWTLQMGFPLITVTMEDNGTFTVEQERFLIEGRNSSSDTHNYKWWVPLTYASRSNPDFASTKPKKWMKPTEAKMSISGLPNKEWFIFNIQQTGYYMVNYNQANWDAIIEQLLRDHTVIHTMNRAQLIDDSLSLASASILPYETVMKILSYLKNENDYVPWSTALSGLNYIQDMFANTGGYGALQEFLLSLTLPMYKKLGFEDNINDPHLDQLKRAEILNNICGLGYKPCIDKAVQMFSSWMQNPHNFSTISPNLKSVVYCTALKEGGYNEWKFAWGRYQNANLASEKSVIMNALGCTKETWIQRGYLKRALTEGKGIRKQDIRTVFGSVSRTDHGKLTAWDFFRDEYNTIFKLFGESFFVFTQIIKSATGGLNSRNNLNELQEFVQKNEGKFGSAERTIQQAFEGVRNNIKWMDDKYDKILQWLTNNGYVNSI